MRFLSITDIVIMSIGCLLLVIWLILFFYSNKYKNMFSGLNEKEYPLCQIYSIGYAVMEIIGYKFKSKYDRKLRNHLSILYEEKYVDYYLRITYTQSISISYVILICSFILYGFSRELGILILGILMSALSVYYFMTLSKQKISKRSESLLNDFSEIVSNLALLINAGMIMREAWTEVAYKNNSSIYLEMQRACDDINNGVSESEAIRRFGMRCIIPEIKKFSSTIIQGIEKGNKELAIMLQSQSDEVWLEKQQRVKRAGEKANTKLMFPMFIMFIGILIMIVIPIFTNMGI